MTWTGRSLLHTAFAFALALPVAREIEAQQPGLGGNIGRAMLLRLNRDTWLIQSHTIGGLPVLPGEPAAEQ